MSTLRPLLPPLPPLTAPRLLGTHLTALRPLKIPLPALRHTFSPTLFKSAPRLPLFLLSPFLALQPHLPLISATLRPFTALRPRPLIRLSKSFPIKCPSTPTSEPSTRYLIRPFSRPHLTFKAT